MEPNNHYMCEEADFFSNICTSKRLYGFFLQNVYVLYAIKRHLYSCFMLFPVLFLLFRYSVLFTVESLSLLYLFFLVGFICSGR